MPSELDAATIERELPRWLPSCCQRGRLGIRVPQGAPAHAGNLAWHQDDGGPAGEVRHIIVWATEQPTELRLPDGHVVISAPYALVWFDNDRVWHRQPGGTDETRRWFLAVRCRG